MARWERQQGTPVRHRAVRDQQLPLGCTVQARHGTVGATAGHTTTPKRGTSIFRADPQSWNLDLRGRYRMKPISYHIPGDSHLNNSPKYEYKRQKKRSLMNPVRFSSFFILTAGSRAATVHAKMARWDQPQ